MNLLRYKWRLTSSSFQRNFYDCKIFSVFHLPFPSKSKSYGFLFSCRSIYRTCVVFPHRGSMWVRRSQCLVINGNIEVPVVLRTVHHPWFIRKQLTYFTYLLHDQTYLSGSFRSTSSSSGADSTTARFISVPYYTPFHLPVQCQSL